MLIEAVCCSLEDATAACEGGAGRIELCSAIELGGLTPSIGLVRLVKMNCDVPAVAMVRPRPSGFCYTEEELLVLVRDCASLVHAGIDGLVIAALKQDRTINIEACRAMIEAARVASSEPGAEDSKDLQLVFHRAFDATPDLLQSLDTLIELGFTRVLTSGGADTALEGTDMLKALLVRADGRIEILPAGGVRASNAREILTRSGCTQLHLRPQLDVEDSTAPFYGGTYKMLDKAGIAAILAA